VSLEPCNRIGSLAVAINFAGVSPLAAAPDIDGTLRHAPAFCSFSLDSFGSAHNKSLKFVHFVHRTLLTQRRLALSVMFVMAQNQDHRARSPVPWLREGSELIQWRFLVWCLVTRSLPAPVAVAVSVAGQLVSIEASGKGRVVTTPAFGFGRASGGSSKTMSAAHITSHSSGRGVSWWPAKPGWLGARAA